MKNNTIIKLTIALFLLATAGRLAAQSVKLRSDPSGDDKDYVSKDLVLKAGQKGTLTQGDELYKLLFESKTLVLDFTIRDTATPIPPVDPPTPKPVTVEAETFLPTSTNVTNRGTYISPGGQGGVANYSQTAAGFKSITFKYAVANEPPNLVVTVRAGTTVIGTFTLKHTGGWGTPVPSDKFNFVGLGSGAISLTTNRNCNLDSFTLEP